MESREAAVRSGASASRLRPPCSWTRAGARTHPQELAASEAAPQGRSPSGPKMHWYPARCPAEPREGRLSVLPCPLPSTVPSPQTLPPHPRTLPPLLTRVPETGGPPGWEGRACGGVGRAITTRVGAVGKPGTCCPVGGRGERPRRAEGWAPARQPTAPTAMDRAPPPKLPLPDHYLRPRRQQLPPWPGE